MAGGEIESILKSFYQISGMDISLVSDKMHAQISFRCPKENFCTVLHRTSECLDICKCSDIDRLAELQKRREPILYTCPFGVTEAMIPIFRADKMIAYLFSALGISEDHGDDNDIAKRATEICPALDGQNLLGGLLKTPHNSPEMIRSYFRQLCVIGGYLEAHDLIDEVPPSIGKLVKGYIKNNLERKITLAELSWNLHLSTVTLTEHFKREYGETIMEYTTRKRMERAKNLLLSSKEPLSPIAQKCGFSDVEYFSRTFKKFFSLSPGEWRRQRLAKKSSEQEEICSTN